MTVTRKVSSALLAFGLVILAACGGGSGSAVTPTPQPAAATTLTGTAAAGAPIIGSVTIKDSSTPALTKTVTIEADGKYTVDVSGLKGPFMMRADGYVGGNEYHLYSAATPEDVGHTVNVTPLTDLIIANVAGSLAKTYFDSGNFSTLTATELNSQSAALQAKLLPVLQTIGVSNSIDLLRSSFSTDHTGLDAALDVIKVTVDPATQVATVRNVITQEEIKSDLAQKSYTGSMTTTAGVATGATAIQAMGAQLQAFSDLYKTSIPSPTDARLLALFDQATFLNGGIDLKTFLSENLSGKDMVGISFANLSIVSMNAAQDAAVVTFTVLKSGKAMGDGPGAWNMIKKAGAWVFTGDQRIADISVRPAADYHPANGMNTGSSINTGLSIDVSDPGAQGIDSAVVTGKGLPAAGLTLAKQMNYSWFSLVGNTSGNYYYLTDAAIDQIADTGEVYTVKLYAGNTLKATYTETLRKRPYKSSELTPASFPAFAASTSADLAKYNGGNLTVNWTLPDGLSADNLNLWVGGGGQSSEANYSLKPADTTQLITMTLSFTPTSRSLWLGARDSFGRNLSTSVY